MAGAGLEITDHASARAVIVHLQQRAREAGASLRQPPPDPLGCCGRGSTGCVWESYLLAVSIWRDDALVALAP